MSDTNKLASICQALQQFSKNKLNAIEEAYKEEDVGLMDTHLMLMEGVNQLVKMTHNDFDEYSIKIFNTNLARAHELYDELT